MNFLAQLWELTVLGAKDGVKTFFEPFTKTYWKNLFTKTSK